MRNLIPSYIRVPVIFLIIFGLVEYFVDSGAQPAFIKFPIVLLFLFLVLIILIAIEAIVGALENVMFQSLSDKEKERFLISKNKAPQFTWIKKTYTKLVGTKPIEEEGELILDHNYDGIKELDNSLPPWWIYSFYASIVFAAVYLINFHVLGNNSQFDEYAEEYKQAEISIAEYKKLKKEVKETFGEQIKALDRQPSNKVPDAVRRIKEQLIAAGMSADEATKKVFTMLQLSNKKDQSITATMGNNSFKNITDPQSAAVSAVTSFGADTKDQGNKEKAASLNTALMATETGINDLIAKRERLVAKDLSGKTKSLTYAEAEKIMIDKINKSKEAGTVITQGTIDEMAKTNPEVRKMINGYDTVVSVWQKIRLEAQGFEGDLSQLNAAQTKLIADSFAAISDAVVAKNRGGILKDQYASLDKLEKQIKNYTKALKGQSVAEQISDRDRLKALNKQIEAINKLAESRKKALAAAQEDANLGRQIEKVRLEIQNAVSVGDTEKAQSLRIDLESLTSQQQTDAQMKAIDTAAEAATKPLKAAMDAITNKQEKLGDAAALAGESLDKLKDRYDKQQAAIKKVNDSMTALYGNAAAAGLTVEAYAKKNKEASAGFVAAMEAATGAAMPKYKEKTYYNGSMLVTEKVPIAPYENALELLAKSGAATGVNEALANSIKGGATLKDVVDAVNGKNGKPALRKDIVVKGDYSNSKEDKEFDGKKVKVLNAEARDAIRKRLKLEPGETFIVDGQKYKQNTTGGTPIWVGPAPQTPALHEGGKISGPGTSTSDSIPAMLSDGEYVFSAKAVDAAGGPDVVDGWHKALRRAEGGPIASWMKPRSPYDSKNNPTGSPYGRYWGELERLYQQSPMGFGKNGRPVFNNAGKDPWGGTEIPGLAFNGKVANFSDYFHQLAEQPRKYSGWGMGIDKSPDRYAGSGASMGGIGSGAYGAINSMFMADGGLVKKQSFLSRLIFGDNSPKYFKNPKTGEMEKATVLKGEVPFGPGSFAKMAKLGYELKYSGEGSLHVLKAIKEGKEIIFLINPPYGRASSGIDGKSESRTGIAATSLADIMKKNNKYE
mgnify:CR=1 FL=1